MVDGFFYYSGLVAWLALGALALLLMGDKLIDWVVASLWTKREFMAFVWDRLKKRKGLQDQKIITPKIKVG